MELLEREPFLGQLTDHLRHVAAGRGRVVFVGGEAGVGKTALVETFRRRVTGTADVLRTTCDALSTPGPLGPLRDLAPALGLRVAPVDLAGAQRETLFRGVLDAFAARPGPTVVIGEDAHWTDGATLDLVRFVARRIDDLALLFVITYRDDEVGPTHPLRLILGDLATAPTVHRMKLPPLSRGAVAALAAGSPLDPAALHRSTGGNPFFLSEVLAAGGEGVPATVGDAVLARAARLAPDARAVLDVAATIGTAIDLDLLAKVAGPVLDAADGCIAGGLLRATADGLAFRHELAREAVLTVIAPPRRRLLHARVLEALREAPAASQDPARLAHHAEAAGDRAATLEFAIAAAEQAEALYAHREAAAQYARALRVADKLPGTERVRLLEGRANACFFSDLGEEAIAAREEALALWRKLGDPLEEGDTLRSLSHLYWLEGRGAESEAAASAALDVLETLPPGPELAMAYSNLAQLRMLDHDLAGTLEWGDRAILLAERLGEEETLIHATTNVGSARYHAGGERGADAIARSLQRALAGGFLDHAVRALNNLAWFTLANMRLDEAEGRFAAAIAYAIDHNLDAYHWYLLAGQASIRLLRGDWGAAEMESHRLLRQPMLSPVTRIVALTTLGQARARRGNPDADLAFDEALAVADRTGKLLRLKPVRAARAEASLLRGDRAQAREEALALRDLIFARGNDWDRGEWAWLLWQCGDRDVPRDDLAEPYALQIAGEWRAAAAAWQAIGCPYEAACAMAQSDDPADVRRAIETFERLGARPAATRAVERLRSLGVRDLPRGPRPATRANPAGLTPREREVLALVAEGLRNAEIADRLYLTPKTVAHHVSAALAKLGVGSRAEAIRAAQRLGIVDPQSGNSASSS